MPFDFAHNLAMVAVGTFCAGVGHALVRFDRPPLKRWSVALRFDCRRGSKESWYRTVQLNARGADDAARRAMREHPAEWIDGWRGFHVTILSIAEVRKPRRGG